MDNKYLNATNGHFTQLTSGMKSNSRNSSSESRSRSKSCKSKTESEKSFEKGKSISKDLAKSDHISQMRRTSSSSQRKSLSESEKSKSRSVCSIDEKSNSYNVITNI